MSKIPEKTLILPVLEGDLRPMGLSGTLKWRNGEARVEEWGQVNKMYKLWLTDGVEYYHEEVSRETIEELLEYVREINPLRDDWVITDGQDQASLSGYIPGWWYASVQKHKKGLRRSPPIWYI